MTKRIATAVAGPHKGGVSAFKEENGWHYHATYYGVTFTSHSPYTSKTRALAAGRAKIKAAHRPTGGGKLRFI